MFNNLFSKLMAGFVGILLLTMIVLTSLMTLIYRSSVFSIKETNLASGAEQVNFQLQMLSDGYIDEEAAENVIDTIGSINDSRVIAITIDKNELITLREKRPANDDSIYDDLIKIMEGHEIFKEKSYSSEIDAYTVFYGCPLEINGKIVGAILQYSPVNSVQMLLYDVIKRLWLVGLAALIIGVVFIYRYSNRIAKPIVAIDKAATAISEGETVEDIQVSGHDEVNHLAVAFNDMKNKLAHIEEMRQDYIAGISHELRTPLTSILGFVQGIQDGLVPPEELPGTLSIIQDETRRMISMTTEILSLVKLENAQNEMVPEKIHLIEALTFIIGTLNIKEKKSGIECSIVCSGDIYINADADRFRQIMLNLLSNAYKYTEAPGNIVIEVTTTEDHMALISVSDTGQGIEEKEIPLVFERFYRTDKSRHSSTGGTGIGLNIVKVMVEQHGGSIWIESKIGEGTQVFFTMPLV